MSRKFARGLVLATSLVIAACSGSGPPSFIPAGTGGPSAPDVTKKGQATVVITIPQQAVATRGRMRHRYVSPATQSIVISVPISGGRTKRFAADLTTFTNPNCKASAGTVVCTMGFSLPPGSYSASVATYDGLLKTGGIPGGRLLSANQAIPLRVKSSKTTTLRLSLFGVPTAVAFLPSASSTLSGNVQDGYVLPRCNPLPQQVSVAGIDADGNLIVGQGSTAVSIISGSKSLAVATPKPTSPNLFTLTPPHPPTYPPVGSTVFLEARATPNSATGSTTPVTTVVKVTFSDDVCGVFTEFPIPTSSSSPLGITAGPDGAVWFTEYHSSKIGRIPITATAADSQITEYTLPTTNAGPEEIAKGADGAMWFSECFSGQIGRMDTNTSTVLEFRIPTLVSKPRGITAGPDGAMWFTESGAGKIGRLPTSGPIVFQEYPVPTATSAPTAIVTGPDGALWFMEARAAQVGRIPTTGGPVTEYPTGAPGTLPRDIAVGPDRNLWFAQCAGLDVGKVPVGGSPVSLYQVAGTYSGGYGITAGPDGALWFTEANSNQIGRVTTDGNVVQFTVPTTASQPRFITVGPDGSLWFTEFLGNKIGRLQ